MDLFIQTDFTRPHRTGNSRINSRCSNPMDSVLYIEASETAPDWILSQIRLVNWTKGKILCEKCGGRIGSFDFTNIRECVWCKNHDASAIHILKNRVDIIETQPWETDHIFGVEKVQVYQSHQTKVNLTENSFELGNRLGLTDDSTMSGLPDESKLKLPEHEDKMSDARTCDNLSRTRETANSETCISALGPSRENESSDLSMLSFQSADSKSCNGQLHEITAKEEASDCQAEEVSDCCVGSDHIRLDIGKSCRSQKCVVEEDDNPYRWTEDEEICMPGNVVAAEKKRQDQHTQRQSCPETKIPPEFTCAVCLELFYRPHKCAPCKHTFCEPCLRQIAREKPTQTPCPLCRNVIMECNYDKDLDSVLKGKYHDLYRERCHHVRKITQKFYRLPRCYVPLNNRTFRRPTNIRQAGMRNFLWTMKDLVAAISANTAYVLRDCLSARTAHFVYVILSLVVVAGYYGIPSLLAFLFEKVRELPSLLPRTGWFCFSRLHPQPHQQRNQQQNRHHNQQQQRHSQEHQVRRPHQRLHYRLQQHVHQRRRHQF